MAPKGERTIDGGWASGYQVKSKMDFLRLDLEVITLDNYFIIDVDCKTVRTSSTSELSNKRSGARLKTESVRLLHYSYTTLNRF